MVHFCYADKFAIIINGLGLVRHIVFLNDDLKQRHPDISEVKAYSSSFPICLKQFHVIEWVLFSLAQTNTPSK